MSYNMRLLTGYIKSANDTSSAWKMSYNMRLLTAYNFNKWYIIRWDYYEWLMEGYNVFTQVGHVALAANISVCQGWSREQGTWTAVLQLVLKIVFG